MRQKGQLANGRGGVLKAEEQNYDSTNRDCLAVGPHMSYYFDCIWTVINLRFVPITIRLNRCLMLTTTPENWRVGYSFYSSM